MAHHEGLSAELIAWTQFQPPVDMKWATDGTDSESLIEFAGRACYETFDKPNPRTANNAAYIHHIMEVGHLALLEHAQATIYLRGISRSATHELIRHRHFSFSQLSQRYVMEDDAAVVVPDLIRNDPAVLELFNNAVDDAHRSYQQLLAALEEKLVGESNALLRKKQARQAARAILPNAQESRIVVTGNYRTWRHFIAMRASEHADAEIRNVAVTCLELLREKAPHVFGDFELTTLQDGSRMATSAYITDF